MDKEYCATYTILINGATWGTKDITFEAEDEEEAKAKVFELEEEYSSKKEELLFDCLYDEDGNEIECERP